MDKVDNIKIRFVSLSGLVSIVWGSVFGGGPSGKFEAVRMTPSGPEVVDETPKFHSRLINTEHPDVDNSGPQMCRYGYNREADAEYDKLVARLSAQGYRPVRSNHNGWIDLMSRQSGSIPQSTDSTEPTELLRQLNNLLRAGILTQQEFDAKKSEILRRI